MILYNSSIQSILYYIILYSSQYTDMVHSIQFVIDLKNQHYNFDLSSRMNQNFKDQIQEHNGTQEGLQLSSKDQLKIEDSVKILNEKEQNFPKLSPKESEEEYKTSFIIQTQHKLIWTSTMEGIFFDLYLKHGSRWSHISVEMNKILDIKNLNGNTLKNKFYTSLRKFMNRVNKLTKHRQFKGKIKFESLQRLLVLRLFSNGELYRELSDDVLDLSQHSDRIITQENAEYIAKCVLLFNKQVKMPTYKLIMKNSVMETQVKGQIESLSSRQIIKVNPLKLQQISKVEIQEKIQNIKHISDF